MDIKLRVGDLNSGLVKCVVNSCIDPIIHPINETADVSAKAAWAAKSMVSDPITNIVTKALTSMSILETPLLSLLLK